MGRLARREGRSAIAQFGHRPDCNRCLESLMLSIGLFLLHHHHHHEKRGAAND